MSGSVPGLLTLTAANETLSYNNGQKYVNTSAQATLNIGTGSIPSQVLILRGYTVVCKNYSPVVADCPIIYVDLPFLGGASLKDELGYMNRLPLPLSIGYTTGSPDEFTGVTSYTEMTMPVQTFQNIPQQFVMSVYNRDGSLVNTSQILSVTVQFSYGFDNPH